MSRALNPPTPPRPWRIDAHGDVFLTCPWDGLGPKNIREALHDVFRTVKSLGLALVAEQYFGRESFAGDIVAMRDLALAVSGLEGGVWAFVQGLPTGPWPLCGAVFLAAAPEGLVRRRTPSGVPVVVRDRGAVRELHMMEVTGAQDGVVEDVAAQTRRVYALADEGLALAELSPADVVRTYFYLRDIDRDYEAFNAVRTAYFRERLPEGAPYPASTGIQGNSRHRDDVVLNLLAFQGVAVHDIPTRRQCEASAYGKLFSRGKIVAGPDGARAYLSGTASIDEAGRTVHIGDPERQIRQTFACVRELLGNAAMDFGHVAWSSVYLKRPEYRELFENLARDEGLEDMPRVVMVAGVCRDDLLFEMDLVAFSG